MKSNFIKSLPLAFLASAISLQSCSDEDFGYSKEQLAYAKQFREAFGKIDPEQDFSYATRSEITVTPGESSEIKIYSKSSGSWKLVGHYSDITSTTTLGVDIVKGVSSLLVSDGRNAIETKVGGSVNFGGMTRSGSYDTGNPGVSEVYVYLNEGPTYPYYYFNNTEATEFRTVLQENGNAAQNYADTQLGNSRVTKNFKYVSTGEFIVYPTFWATGTNDVVGVYYYDGMTKVLVPIFANGQGNESLQYRTIGSSSWTRETSLSGGGTANAGTLNREWRSKGVIVNLPVGTEFGFYLRSNDGVHHYSDADENKIWDVSTKTEGVEQAYLFYDGHTDEKTCYCASYYDSRGDLILGMEDWHDWGSNNHSDFDLNDLMFKFGGNAPIVVDNTTDAWILAYEDLGESYDWDYNDVILKFEYASGESTAKITPLAAGGTLHSRVFFKETPSSEEQPLKEIHAWMLNAQETDINVLYDPINASERGAEGSPIMVSIANPTGSNAFSVTSWGDAMLSGGKNTTNQSAEAACGVYLKVVSPSATQNQTTYVAYEGAGNVPEMLILPYTYKIDSDSKSYVWSWPTEETDIRDAYSDSNHKFAEWVGDHTQHGDWYMYPTPNVGPVVEALFSMTGSDDNTIVPEYDLSDYGTSWSVPNPNNNVYDFSDKVQDLPNGGAVILTIVAKGAVKIGTTHYGANLGSWKDLDGNTIAVNTMTGLSQDIEGVYQATLNAIELGSIKEANSLLIVSGKEILQVSAKIVSGCPISVASSAVISTGDNVFTVNVPYTTASTGAVTINPTEQSGVSASVNQVTKVITFTATESTVAGDYNFTINQASDANYAAGSKDITITVSTLRSAQLAIETGTPVRKLTTKGETATVTYTTLSSGAVTVNQPANGCATVTVDEANKTVTVTAKKTGQATITISQAEVTDTYSAANVSFDIEVEIALTPFPLNVATPVTLETTSKNDSWSSTYKKWIDLSSYSMPNGANYARIQFGNTESPAGFGYQIGNTETNCSNNYAANSYIEINNADVINSMFENGGVLLGYWANVDFGTVTLTLENR